MLSVEGKRKLIKAPATLEQKEKTPKERKKRENRELETQKINVTITS